MHPFLRIILAIVFIKCLSPDLYSQDPRFSQFYAAPTQFNPAMIGVSPGKLRFTASYRELYASILGNNPYRTIASSFDMRFRVVQDDYLGVGLSFMRDQVGIANYNRTQGNLGLSFMKQLGGSRYASNDQYLVAGAQFGFGQRAFNWTDLWFSNQFDSQNAVINFDNPTGESFDQNPTSFYLDFNAGILWYALFDDNMSIYAGGALQHINRPDISFIEGQKDELFRKWVAHAGGEVPITNELSLLPGAIFMAQGPSMSTTFGGNFRYTNREWRELAIRAGTWGHLNNWQSGSMGFDALIITAVLELENWNLGVSYDITTSTLAEANNARGAFEITLSYFKPEQSRHRVNCPKY